MVWFDIVLCEVDIICGFVGGEDDFFYIKFVCCFDDIVSWCDVSLEGFVIWYNYVMSISFKVNDYVWWCG